MPDIVYEKLWKLYMIIFLQRRFILSPIQNAKKEITWIHSWTKIAQAYFAVSINSSFCFAYIPRV